MNNGPFRIIQTFLASAVVAQKFTGIVMQGDEPTASDTKRLAQLSEADAALDRLDGKIYSMRHMLNVERFRIEGYPTQEGN